MKNLMILAVALLISVFTFSQNEIERLHLMSRYVVTEEAWGRDTAYLSQQFVIDFKEMTYIHIVRNDREALTSLYDITGYHYNRSGAGYLMIIRNQFGEDDQMTLSLSDKGNFTLRVGNHTTSGLYTMNPDN